MKIAVVTPVFQSNRSWLEKCLASVRQQTIRCTHFLINDGDPSLIGCNWPGVDFFHLPQTHANEGFTAMAIGALSAVAQNYDAVAFLGADHWFETTHLQQLVEMHKAKGAAVCTAGRNLVDGDGKLLGKCFEVDGDKYVDANAILLTKEAFGLLSAWQHIPRSLALIGDRIIWKAIRDANICRSHNHSPTVNFRTAFASHFTYFKKKPPLRAKHIRIKTDANGNFVSADCSVLEESYIKAFDRTKGVDGPSVAAVANAKRSRVSLCMIVKNEEANLVGCLEPVAGLFDEIVVVDTGSTDATKECARKLGAKVFDFTWVDSFAAARNESLRHATGDWIFWLDGDDSLDEANLTKLRRLLGSLTDENNAYMMCQWSAPDRSTGTSLVVDQTRLFRNLRGLEWTYRVHEQILVPLKERGARDVRTDVIIHHLGYQDAEVRGQKRERNIRLLQLDLKDKPDDAFICFNLANAYLDASRIEDSVGMMKRCLERAPAGASYVPKVYFMMAGAYHLQGRDDLSLQYCRDGKSRFPKAVDIWFQEGVLLLAEGDLPGARKCFETILALPSQSNYVGIDPNLPQGRTRHNLAFIYRRLGLKQKAEEQWLLSVKQSVTFEPAWLALLELYIEQNRFGEVEGLLDQLRGNPAQSTIEPALLARLRVAKKDIAGACRILEEALSRNTKAIWLRILFADILLRLANDKQGAERQMREILNIAPNEQQTRRKLAALLANKKQHDSLPLGSP